MGSGKLLVIEDDQRVSRLVCHVAERMGLDCDSITSREFKPANIPPSPDIVFLGVGKPLTLTKKILQALAAAPSKPAIVLAGDSNLEGEDMLRELGESLGLNISTVLPGIFDADILKEQFATTLTRILAERAWPGGHGQDAGSG